MENQAGWVEVMVHGITKKDRLGTFVAVPSNCTVGTTAKLETSPTLQPKEKQKTASSSSAPEVKLPIESLFYWYCNHCQISNSLLSRTCQVCKEKRDPSRSTSSALLGFVENASQFYGEGEAHNVTPYVHQRSIPLQIQKFIQRVRKCSSDSEIARLTTPPPLHADTVFYWQCSHCTMDNSFKRWSCAACKRKVRLVVCYFQHHV